MCDVEEGENVAMPEMRRRSGRLGGELPGLRGLRARGSRERVVPVALAAGRTALWAFPAGAAPARPAVGIPRRFSVGTLMILTAFSP